MSRGKKALIVISAIWALISVLAIFNLVYIDRPEMMSDFWLVFVRSVGIITVLPLLIIWGVVWVLKKP